MMRSLPADGSDTCMTLPPPAAWSNASGTPLAHMTRAPARTIGQGYPTWAFAEAAMVCRRNIPSGQPFLSHLTKKYGKGKAVIVIASKWPHAVDICCHSPGSGTHGRTVTLSLATAPQDVSGAAMSCLHLPFENQVRARYRALTSSGERNQKKSALRSRVPLNHRELHKGVAPVEDPVPAPILRGLLFAPRPTAVKVPTWRHGYEACTSTTVPG